MQMVDERAYPTRPFLAASAAVIRDGRVLIVRRGGTFGRGIYTLPGGVVEAGEKLTDAVIREVREETQVSIEPVALAGYREMIMRDDAGKTSRHFVIACFAARWLSGEPVPDLTEIAEAAWRLPEELDGLKTTEGLREIIADAMAKL
ncbi:NUDIX hydrolase [Pseudorhodoplanes sp.]|uniref:NUDIX hydrolase n=1 Tax=Pseudorhodoplanes sp. TaxID=1934341 RepID=UPI002B7499A9|nr:NUDIX hydrolase [Pseudorhodoplanes sp.]HWV52382.1 NUDIX hydrolase [Pseudorhodoplanes sp.]